MTCLIKYEKTFLLKDHEHLMDVYQEHYNEVYPGILPEKIELDLSQVVYLEEQKAFFSVKAELEGKTVGLISGYVYNHMQHKTKRFASTSFIQVDKELGRRRVEAFQGLIKKFEEVAKNEYSCDYVQVVLSTKKDVSRIVESMGYGKTDITLTRKI